MKNPKEVQKIITYLKEIELISENRQPMDSSQYNLHLSSLSLKILLEQAFGLYIATEDMTAAMFEYGFTVKQIPNGVAFFNLSDDQINHLSKLNKNLNHNNNLNPKEK